MKEVRIMIRLKVLIANGMMTDQSVSRRPTPLTSRNSGTRPPLKNIVNRIRNINRLFHITFLRERTKAPIAVSSKFIATPTIRMNSVLE
ncbi:hypothetical protein D3C73_1497630 [compost metagenome]